MKEKRQGFTLIELLVVVLIIGILATVALPQYTKAVEKSRATEARINLQAVVAAEKVYKLANGTATYKFDNLDIGLAGEPLETGGIKGNYFTYTIVHVGSGPEGFEALATRNDEGQNSKKYYIYFSYLGNYNCVAKAEEAKTICGNLCGTKNLFDHPGGTWACQIKN